MTKRWPGIAMGLWSMCLVAWITIAVADVWDRGDQNPLTTANELLHGSEQVHQLGPSGSGSGRDVDHFRIEQRSYASYAVVVDGVTNDISNELVLERMVNGTVAQTAVAASVGDQTRTLSWMTMGPSNFLTTRIRVHSSQPCNGCSSSFASYHIRAYDTTYTVPRFNNSATQVTVLLVHNQSDLYLNARVHFWAADGTLLGSQPYYLSPNRLLVQNTSELPFAAGAAGSMTITHTGRYGDLSGKAVALEPATGFTFETPLTPVPR